MYLDLRMFRYFSYSKNKKSNTYLKIFENIQKMDKQYFIFTQTYFLLKYFLAIKFFFLNIYQNIYF